MIGARRPIRPRRLIRAHRLIGARRLIRPRGLIRPRRLTAPRRLIGPRRPIGLAVLIRPHRLIGPDRLVVRLRCDRGWTSVGGDGSGPRAGTRTIISGALVTTSHAGNSARQSTGRAAMLPVTATATKSATHPSRLTASSMPRTPAETAIGTGMPGTSAWASTPWLRR